MLAWLQEEQPIEKDPVLSSSARVIAIVVKKILVYRYDEALLFPRHFNSTCIFFPSYSEIVRRVNMCFRPEYMAEVADAFVEKNTFLCHTNEHLPQQLFQFQSFVSFLVAVLHNHRRVERQIPLSSFAFGDSARAGYDNGILRNF